MPETEMRTYEIEHNDGTRRHVKVPSDWKVTFGPSVVGYNKKSNIFSPHNASRTKTVPLAIRFYESKEHQRAIYTDVISFKDLSIEETVFPPSEIEESLPLNLPSNVRERYGYTQSEPRPTRPQPSPRPPRPQPSPLPSRLQVGVQG